MISRCLCELNAYSIGLSLICMAEMQVVPIFSSLGLCRETGGHCSAALERGVYLKDREKLHLAVSTCSSGCRKLANLPLTFIFPPQQPFFLHTCLHTVSQSPQDIGQNWPPCPVPSPNHWTHQYSLLFRMLERSALQQPVTAVRLLWQPGCIILSSVCWFTEERERVEFAKLNIIYTRSEAPGVSVCATRRQLPSCSQGAALETKFPEHPL